ncbi:MAG TPA: hypothetical protein VF855_00175, partial [Acidimicrobiales bacterium]
TPPVVDPTRPRYAAIRAAVQDLLNPAQAASPSTTAAPVTTAKGKSAKGSTTTLPPAFEAGATLDEQCAVG